ncbi:hypothetical protein F4818DRAFT_187795 [Hypoxylon cercidicola]|nr:hypothetical protein F4818DRAFT_187795 [Hypoxylon cercidicola]
MFRFLRSRPNPFSLGARVHGAHSPSPGIIQIQRVKIRRKWFKPMNFVIAGCVYYACYRVYEASVFRTFSDWDDAQEKQMTRKERDDAQEKQMTRKEREELEEDLLEPIFIPLPFTTQLVDSPPYKSTDPEWQGFIKFNKNRELVRRVQGELADLVRKTAQANSSLVYRCGGDMKLGRYWLDIQYPSRPPPIFVRKGLSIGDYGISIVEEPIDTVAALWVSRSLYPSVLAMSFWSFSATLMKQNASNLAKLFGYEQNSPPPPPLQQAIEKVQQQIKKPTAKSDSQESSSFPHANTRASDGSSTGSTSTIEKRPVASSPAPGSSTTSSNSTVIPIVPSAESDKPRSAKDMHGIKHTQEHMSGAWKALKRKFDQTWRPMRDLPPRGAIYISGLVEINTPRALMTIDCTAWWDPKTERFDSKTSFFRIRTFRLRTQTALGR